LPQNNNAIPYKVNYLIETERLLLRRITLGDKEDLFKLHSNLAVQKYTGEPVVDSIEEIETAIHTRIKNYKKYGYGRWATILKNGMQFVGWAGLAYLPEFDEIDLGYRFLPEYWGAGIATEASQAILTYGFDTLKLEKIIAIAMKEHKASIRVMEKVGMEFDKFAPYELGSQDAAWYWCKQKRITKNKAH
jgi:ribosomal-protein-alanine N-acetyltransferase